MLDFEKILNEALEQKECYYGPFAGEFGWLLAHILPFMSYLYSKGVRIHFCGNDGQESLCIDDEGNHLYASYTSVPYFFDKSAPNGNVINLVPLENRKVIDEFVAEAKDSHKPFFDISSIDKFDTLWEFWYAKKYGFYYNLNKYFNPDGIIHNRISLYTRNKPYGKAGEVWNIPDIIEAIESFCDEIVIVGNPNQSFELNHPKVRNIVTRNNAKIFNAVSTSKLVLSPNSGSAYVARILQVPQIIYMKGPREHFDWTMYCSDPFCDSKVELATSIVDIYNLTEKYE